MGWFDKKEKKEETPKISRWEIAKQNIILTEDLILSKKMLTMNLIPVKWMKIKEESMNKQPFYHEISILFTATKPLTEEELEHVADELRADKDVLNDSVQIQFVESEAGDPADLM